MESFEMVRSTCVQKIYRRTPQNGAKSYDDVSLKRANFQVLDLV